MKHDRSGQLWSLDTGDDGKPVWSPFLIVSTTFHRASKTRAAEFEPYGRKDLIEHLVVVSDQFERTIVVNLNEDPEFPWETCVEQYRRID